MFFVVANNRILATRGKVYVQLPDLVLLKETQICRITSENEVLQKTVIDFIRLTNEWDNKIQALINSTEKELKLKEVVPTKALVLFMKMDSAPSF